MKINFKKENITFRFVKEEDKLYFYHPGGLHIFTKDNVNKYIYDGDLNFCFRTGNTEYVFASNLGKENTENIIFSGPTQGTYITIRYEYWLCPKAISNLYKLAHSL